VRETKFMESKRNFFLSLSSFEGSQAMCRLVLLVEASLREGKVLGSCEGKGLGAGLCYEQRS
jgi:hypothetical protein